MSKLLEGKPYKFRRTVKIWNPHFYKIVLISRLQAVHILHGQFVLVLYQVSRADRVATG